MKTKYLMLLAALTFSFMACENNTPYDTQSPDDQPLILVPYETETGQLSYTLASPETPLLDSVIVTPSKYTTVNWYLDDQLVYTGSKIEMCFPAGTYTLTIEAVTEAGKRTSRSGLLTVRPNATDPYSAATSGVHHLAPGVEMSVNGDNLDKAAKIVLTRDLYGADTICTVLPTEVTATSLKVTLPDMEDCTCYLFYQDAEKHLYGSNKLQVHNNPIVFSGYAEFAPGDAWIIRGVKLQDVASVKIGEVEVTTLTATPTTITLTAPNVPLGIYALSITTKNGSPVLFSTANGLVQTVEAVCSAEHMLWEGPVGLDWDTELIKVTKEDMTKVALGATIRVYYEITPAGYHCIRINTPDWGDETSYEFNLVPQVNGLDGEDKTSPLTFEYDVRSKNLVDGHGAMCAVGNGATVTKITYENP